MWIDLTQPFSDEMPYSEAFDELGLGPELETVMDVEKNGANVMRYENLTHIGTHVDAPIHFVPGGKTIDELSLDAFSGTGVTLDVSKDEPEEISPTDLKAADGEVREGDIVVLYTGWYHRYGGAEYDPHPWLTAESADWLLDRGIKMLAVDNITPDLPGPLRPEGYDEFPVHRKLLGNDVLIAEHLTNLEGILGERVEFQALPLKIEHGDGSPVRFAARRTD